jgi:hypothetical protein
MAAPSNGLRPKKLILIHGIRLQQRHAMSNSDNSITRMLELTAPEIYERWPAGSDRPRLRAVTEWLRELSDEGRLVRSGQGHRYVPFRYRLAAEAPAATGEPAASAAA